MSARTKVWGVAAVVMLAACSSGGGDAGPDTSLPTDSTPAGDSVPVIIDGDDCVRSASAFGAVASMAGESVSNPGNFDLAEFEQLIEDARKAVAPEIREEYDLFSEAYLELGRLLDEIGGVDGLVNPANQDKVTRVGELFSDAEVQAAAQSLTRYFENACRIS